MDIQYYLNEASILVSDGKLTEAIIPLSKVIKIDSSNLKARYQRGWIYFKIKRFEEAIIDINKAIECDSNFAEAYYLRGISNNMIENYDNGVGDFTSAINLDLNYTHAYFARGYSYFHKAKYMEAIKDYSKVIKLDSNYTAVFLNRGNSYFNNKNYYEAIADFTQEIIYNTYNKKAFQGRGNAYSAIGKFQEAINDFTKIIKLDSSDVDAYIGRGVAYAEEKLYEEAIIDFNKSIDLCPDYSHVYYKRGLAYTNILKYEETIKDYSKVIDLDSSYANIYLDRANAYINNKNFDEAINDYNYVLSYDSMNKQAYFGCGYAYREKNNYTEAINHFNKAIEVDSNYMEAYCERGIAFGTIKFFEDAIKDFNKAIDIYSNYLYALYNRAYVYFMQDKYEDALNEYNKILELDSVYTLAYYGRGLLYYTIEKFQEAFENYVILEELSRSTSEIAQYGYTLMSFLSSFDAPFFLNRIINRLYSLETFISYETLISNNFKDCSSVQNVLAYFESTNFIDKTKHNLLKGIITYYLNDPSICYKIFDEKVDLESPANLTGQYYYILSCDNYLLSEDDAILKNALNEAITLLNINGNSTDFLQIYYAGQIFFIANNYYKAVECFSYCSNFIPAICMEAICYNILGENKKRDSLLDELMFLDKHNRGLLQFKYIPKLSIEKFEESVMRYSHMREIEGIIQVIEDYVSEKEILISSLYKNILPNTYEVFSIDENTKEGKDTIESINLWKQDVLNAFCVEHEILFSTKIKDHFNGWNQEMDMNKLELQLGSDIPFFCLKEGLETLIVDLIDYYNVKGKISHETRYLLAFWVKLCKFRNKKLSETEKKTVKFSISYLFKISLGYSVIPISIPSVLLFLGVEITKDYFVKKIISFIEETFLNTDMPIPEFYIDFKLQFSDYFEHS